MMNSCTEALFEGTSCGQPKAGSESCLLPAHRLLPASASAPMSPKKLFNLMLVRSPEEGRADQRRKQNEGPRGQRPGPV